MSNLEKINEMLKKDPELLEKLQAETRRLSDSGEKDIRKISAEAIRAVFDTDLSDEELDHIVKASRELDLNEMENVSAAGFFDIIVKGIGNVVNGVVNGIRDTFTPDDKNTDKQNMPGFNVY